MSNITDTRVDLGARHHQEFGLINDGNGRSLPMGGGQQYKGVTLYGTPAARARVVAALDILNSDQYAADLLRQFVKRIDCVQLPDRLSRHAVGYPFQAVDPRWPSRVIADFVFKGAFYNGGWGDAQERQVEIELQKLGQRLGGRHSGGQNRSQHSSGHASTAWQKRNDWPQRPSRHRVQHSAASERERAALREGGMIRHGQFTLIGTKPHAEQTVQDVELLKRDDFAFGLLTKSTDTIICCMMDCLGLSWQSTDRAIMRTMAIDPGDRDAAGNPRSTVDRASTLFHEALHKFSQYDDHGIIYPMQEELRNRLKRHAPELAAA